VVLKNNIQTAMNNIFGLNNTKVWASNPIDPTVYDIDFVGGLTNTNVERLEKANVNFGLQTVVLSDDNGTTAQGFGNEVQRIDLNGSSTWKLSFNGAVSNQTTNPLAGNAPPFNNPTVVNPPADTTSVTAALNSIGATAGFPSLNGNVTVF